MHPVSQKPIFVPREPDHDDIEEREQDEPDGVRELVAVELVNDEEREYDESDWVIPEALPQEADDEPELHDAVAEQIGGGEVLHAHGKPLHRMEEVGGNEVVRVFRKLALGHDGRRYDDEMLRDEIRQDAAHNFKKREGALEPQAHVEREVDVLLAKQSPYVGA